MKTFAIAVLTGLILAMTPVATAAPAAPNLKDCDGVYSSGTYRNVTVQAGSSCTLNPGVTVIGGVRAAKGASDLYVHTSVGRNIQAKGVTGTVMVGPRGCKYDPPVGNNVHVSDSHNVLICFVDAGNNIMVTGNDGQITVRDSSADNNVMVNRNLKYVADGPVKHKHAGAIRLLRVTAGGHVTTKGNDPSRLIIRRDIIAGH
jgi:hypothetical protein